MPTMDFKRPMLRRQAVFLTNKYFPEIVPKHFPSAISIIIAFKSVLKANYPMMTPRHKDRGFESSGFVLITSQDVVHYVPPFTDSITRFVFSPYLALVS